MKKIATGLNAAEKSRTMSTNKGCGFEDIYKYCFSEKIGKCSLREKM